MNELTSYFVPQWVSILFLLTIPLPFVLISTFVFKRTAYRSPFFATIAFFVFYLAYISIASYLGWFNVVAFPPRVLLYTTFPFAFLLFGVVTKTTAYRKILTYTPIEDFVRLHIFRLIGVFFLLLAYYEALPTVFAWIAGLGDIITAIGSIFVVNALQNGHKHSKRWAYIWNIFGTVDILFTAISANVITKIAIDTGTMGVDTLAMFPFCIIPAFAPPTILFLHWTIFLKLKKKSS
ncbi:hypothetical protein [Runella limosa]|uniref:hypothetical protein n=1 Tax=Runella limosa TaxID=370978 RepID=UPI0004198A2F|nr:hypothetical protein [Runella limosa]